MGEGVGQDVEDQALPLPHAAVVQVPVALRAVEVGVDVPAVVGDQGQELRGHTVPGPRRHRHRSGWGGGRTSRTCCRPSRCAPVLAESRCAAADACAGKGYCSCVVSGRPSDSSDHRRRCERRGAPRAYPSASGTRGHGTQPGTLTAPAEGRHHPDNDTSSLPSRPVGPWACADLGSAPAGPSAPACRQHPGDRLPSAFFRYPVSGHRRNSLVRPTDGAAEILSRAAGPVFPRSRSGAGFPEVTKGRQAPWRGSEPRSP